MRRTLWGVVVVCLAHIQCKWSVRDALHHHKHIHKRLVQRGANAANKANKIEHKLQSSSLLVVIYPSDVDGRNRGKRLEAISKTWGRELNEIGNVANVKTILVATTEEAQYYKNKMPGVHDFFAENMMIVPPALVKKLHEGVWLGKVDMGPLFVHMHWVLEQILTQEGANDWVFLASDETFVFPHNLYCYLNQLDPSTPLHTGEMLKADYRATGTDFVSVAAGWAFSVAFLKLFMNADTPCKAGNDWEEINWAVALGRCISETPSLKDTFHDERVDKKAHRFNAFGPDLLVRGKAHSWFQGE
jgi:hypothetical protein